MVRGHTTAARPMHTTFYKRPATRVLETRVAGRFSPTVQFVVVCIDTNARHQRVCIDNTHVCIASASLHTRVCIATHARQGPKVPFSFQEWYGTLLNVSSAPCYAFVTPSFPPTIYD
ncbi:hypothetical protein SFRURICE_019109 [Spodoptera frugiperda]|nr:hypothetical protein SFRURICE_019109 [Spodoptera frugiperda]